MTVELGFTLVALGFVGAFVSGLVGVGGAIVMIPLLYYVPPLLGTGRLDFKSVAGVTMVQVLTAALVGAWTHGSREMVHRRLAWTGGASMAVGSLAGAIGSRWVSGRLLLGVFALMTTIALPLMLAPPARLGAAVAEASVPFDRAAAIGYPGVIGVMAGLVGAGGAFLTVPVLVALVRVPLRLAIGTSLAMTAMSAAMGVVGKAVTGQVPPGPAASVLLGALGGAFTGARLSPRVPVKTLRWVLIVVIAVVTVRVWIEVIGR